MVQRTLIAAIGFFLATFGAASAQTPDHLHGATTPVYEGPPLTLRAAIEDALVHNPALIAGRKQFEAVQKRPATERFLMPPSLEAQIWQWPVTTVNPLNTDMYMFTVQQQLPGRGKRDLRAAVAAKDAELAGADVAVRGREVVTAVMQAYAELAVARRASEIHLASVDMLRQFADASTLKYSAGRSSQQDVLKAIVELSRVHEELVMHEEKAATAAARLNTLLDRDPQSPIGPLEEPREDLSLPESEELQRLALERQPELRIAQLGVERAQASLAAVNRDDKPDFMVGGGYMLMPREAGAWTASIGMTWPNAPWSRGRLDAQKAAAAAAIEAASAQVRVVERQIRQAVHEAYIRAQAATQRASLLQSTIVPQSEHALEVSRVAYQSDRADFLALIESERALLDAQLNYYQALSDRELALADLSRAVGIEIPQQPNAVAVNEAQR